jgi:2-C-methyl-D-erythritol 4-phosphate cytidylyltransferase
MGTSMPKQYLNLHGIPVLARTILAFQNHPLVDCVLVTVPPGDEEFCRTNIVQRFRLTKVKGITAGGLERQESVFNGLRELADTDFVAIHDGVRPLVSPSTITRTFEAAETVGASLACSPVRDTVKRGTGNGILTIPREDLWLAHTPQTFRTALIIEAHRAALRDGFFGTDDASLVERLGHRVAVVEEDNYNIKITTPSDLKLAELLIGSQSV